MMPSLRQFLLGTAFFSVRAIATGGTVLRSAGRVDGDHQTTSTFSLHRQGVAELRPRSIGNRLGEAMVLYHALNIEFFDGNHAEAVDQPAGLLMHKVMTAVLDPLVNAPHDLFGLFSCFRPVLIFNFIKPALCFGEGGFLLAEEARVLDELTVGEGREGF